MILLPSLDRCVARVAARTGHGFTDEAAARDLHGSFARAPIEARHVLADPPEDVAAVAGLIVDHLTAGRLRHTIPRR